MTRGERDKAEDMCLKSLDISERHGYKEYTANQYGNLGVIYLKRGNKQEAKKYWEKAHTLYEEVGAKLEITQVKGWLEDLGEE